MPRRTSAPCECRAAVASAPAKNSRPRRNQSFDGQTLSMRQDDIKLQVLGTLAGFGGTVAKIGIPILAGATSYSNFVECMKEIEEQFGEVELKFKEREDACLGAVDLTTG